MAQKTGHRPLPSPRGILANSAVGERAASLCYQRALCPQFPNSITPRSLPPNSHAPHRPRSAALSRSSNQAPSVSARPVTNPHTAASALVLRPWSRRVPVRAVWTEHKKDAVALLKADHRKVESLFEQFEKATCKDQKKRMTTRICTEFTIHASAALVGRLAVLACRTPALTPGNSGTPLFHSE
jgi:hypothetical protein